MTTKVIATIKRSPDLSGCGNASYAILDQTCINTIRTLSMDAVQQANSGHPGTPMALAPVIYTLWQRFLRFDPNDLIGPIVIASSCQMATRQCCCTRCC